MSKQHHVPALSGTRTSDLIVTRYNLAAECNLRIAQISDMHEESPDEVIRLLQAEKPDLIMITGDLIEQLDEERRVLALKQWDAARGAASCRPHGAKAAFQAAAKLVPNLLRKICYRGRQYHRENAYRLLEEAAKLAPTYYSLGNHEYYLMPEDYAVISRYGITLLDNAYVHTHGICIGGLSSLHLEGWLEQFRQEKKYKILLMHHPEYYDSLHEKLDGIDLILSGHAHGGQWRIAGKGILAPGQGLFPKYVHGIYDKRMIVSAGLSNTLPVPRFGNPKEHVILNLQRESTS